MAIFFKNIGLFTPYAASASRVIHWCCAVCLDLSSVNVPYAAPKVMTTFDPSNIHPFSATRVPLIILITLMSSVGYALDLSKERGGFVPGPLLPPC